ncbi:class I SAM-dependent methyltransferase [Novosphingobium sp. BL-52-GroH]|uniref:class I SAM-dependent methyltransferase n=1 Tax=Novosphingobium sp. BL-52-GroH TaxID=3349877 RepID=UPI00384D9E1D
MTLARRLANQLAHPRGRPGRLLGAAMEVVNRRPMRLAVDLLGPLCGEEVLDAGCGTGAAIAEIRRRADCQVTGVDRSATMLDVARRSVVRDASWLLADLNAVPLPDCSFDAVLALNLLYFDGPEGLIVREMHRLLRPGGRLVAYVTHRESMQDWNFAREGLHRLYDAKALREALVDGGFGDTRVKLQEKALTRTVRGILALAVRHE